MIKAQGDAGIVACSRQFFHRVALESGGFDDCIVAHLRVEHAEPIVVFAGNHDVADAGVLGGLNPLRGVEFYRIKLTG